MPDICAAGSTWPSVTSVLVTVKLGTTGKRQNGSFMVALHSAGLWVQRNQRPEGIRAEGPAFPEAASPTR